MTYEIYRYIFIGAAVLCGIMLVTTIILFFLLKIPGVIGELNGSTARKAIENIRNRNESAENKGFGHSYATKMHSKTIDKADHRRNYTSNLKKVPKGTVTTEGNPTQRLASNETTLLDYGQETSLLSYGTKSDIVENPIPSQNKTFENGFQIISDITFIHTNEIIPAEVN